MNCYHFNHQRNRIKAILPRWGKGKRRLRLRALEAKMADILVGQAEVKAGQAEIKASQAEIKACVAELKALWLRAELQKASR